MKERELLIEHTFADGIGQHWVSRGYTASDDQTFEKRQARYQGPDQQPANEPCRRHDRTEEYEKRSAFSPEICFG